MYIAYHDVKAWKFSRCGLAGNRLVNVGNGTNITILPSISISYFGRQNSIRGERSLGGEERIFYHISLIF